MKRLIGAFSFLVLLTMGCTDANRSEMFSVGSSFRVTCYSGGKVIWDGNSTGKVLPEAQSDGWYFEDAKTTNLVRVSGDCVIAQN